MHEGWVRLSILGQRKWLLNKFYIQFLFICKNRFKVINYSMSEGEEMDVKLHRGKFQFVDNLFQWAKSFHKGRKFHANIAWGCHKISFSTWIFIQKYKRGIPEYSWNSKIGWNCRQLHMVVMEWFRWGATRSWQLGKVLEQEKNKIHYFKANRVFEAPKIFGQINLSLKNQCLARCSASCCARCMDGTLFLQKLYLFFRSTSSSRLRGL